LGLPDLAWFAKAQRRSPAESRIEQKETVSTRAELVGARPHGHHRS
jgi:hypothetical protein